MDRNLSKAYGLIRLFEGLRLKAYQDVVGVWTIGYGTTAGVHPGMVITRDQAEAMMQQDVQARAKMILNWISVDVTDNELSAMISLAYNIGLVGFHHSHLLADLNAGKDKRIVAADFMAWVHAGGHVVPGLVTRRKEETQVFLS
jgi:GH24 family phage-related lysozyme (muramidase)